VEIPVVVETVKTIEVEKPITVIEYKTIEVPVIVTEPSSFPMWLKCILVVQGICALGNSFEM